ncbi:MAG: aldo/keto reductase [Spirochaetia bacterium]|nr:aldo/keto reductase [Spirochaetia bacterium]
MKYRRFPQAEDSLSILGFGCMRLPLKSADSKDIDREQATAMMRKAIDRGVNYIDTAYPYHGGESEPFTAEVLADGYREKVHLATKLPSWLVSSREDFDKYLNEQLKRLQTDHIDYYLLHALDKDRWEELKKHGVFDFMDTARTDGRVRNIGFSFHDDLDTFKTIIDAYNWDFCQIQYNYLDTHMQAGSEGLAYAYDRGIGIVVMEPLRGGGIAGDLPEDIQQVFDRAPRDWTAAEWALRWVWNDPRVSVVLSGMSSMAQTDENLAVAENAESGALSKEDLSVVEEVKGMFLDKIEVPCTSCGYCMPCPHDVNIPEAFRFYNNALMFEDTEGWKENYLSSFKGHTADMCIACGECEPQCPQHIAIIDSLEAVSDLFCR